MKTILNNMVGSKEKKMIPKDIGVIFFGMLVSSLVQYID